MKSYSRFLTTTLTAAYLSMAGTAALGDDTEIFFNNAQQIVKPNVMLILDVSGSMGTDDVVVDAAAGTTETRLAAMKRAAKDLVNSLTDVKVGLMIFGGSEGAYFKAPIADISTQRSSLINKIDGLVDSGGTPLSESLFEAMRYYQGGSVFIRSHDEDGTQVAGIVDSSDSTKFDSPIEYSCQSNYALVLTDGAPTNDSNHETTIESAVGTCSDNCLDEIADYMWTEDMIPSASDPNGDFPGDQKVRTYTIGLKSQQTLLEDTARKGGGSYFVADNASQLTAALKQVFDDAKAQSTTYVAPGIAVNSFDRLNHLDTLYYALFESAEGAIWNGNLKRYKLDIQKNATTGENEAVIVDVNGNAAIDQATGFFKKTARSWWTPIADGPDGPDVAKGGAASQLPDTTSARNVFSNLNSRKSDLSDNSNSVVANNNNLTKADFGDSTMTDAEFSKLISWTRGVDVNDEDGDNDTTDARKLLADPLHSVPQLVIYSGTTVANQDTTIYYGDNQGYIHAVDGEDGSSYFSFIPKELLSNQPAMMNSTSASAKEYGMDGTVVSWIYDDNFDGQIKAADNDFVYIYSGMRRGGRSYYALDVTDRTAPSLLWQITGGVSGTDYEEMGQTWSTPVKTKIAIGNSNYDVLIFGGGYDPDQDNATVRTADDEGRAVYIVDATNGNVLWWAGPTGSGADMEMADMDYSIPAAPKVLDVNGDGLADQIYVGDMGGQIFRFDISNTAKLTDLVTGGRIADFGGSTTASNRRFYHSPDLFGIKLGGVRYLGLIIGSGFQAHPLNKDVDDRIYMMKISAVSSAPLDPTDATQTTVLYKSLTESDLYDATDNLIQQGTSTEKTAAASALATADGWFIKLDNNPGEKVLSESVTVNNEVFITTYEPKASSDPCRPPTGTSRLYHISVLDGSAVRNYYTSDGKGDDELTRPDRYVELDVPLPSNPQRMRVDDTDVICVGTDCQTIKSIKGVVETYWYED
ncbi:Type IV fimbrial biogenesis protein PilY1 [Marinobacter nitratireducens]|uniref:Type IV fimbrial biogenesis protein PilY1 n=1 Tax=Marinobacter nitratireducens TaxID=1137280 RepID=A0A072N9J0_9GAMM|nr:PilC/PilY family type IV pilus protein [Marinobacter nitratireducens]KEF29700.1 Type IV fimbrial biogenesis protein PilY1 [Marinobacter nitratireducens]